MMSDAERKIRQRLRDDFAHYAEKCLRIRTKEGGLLAFHLNQAQRYLHEVVEKQLAETGKVRVIILKGRQQGMSTYVEGRLFWKVTHRTGVRAFILAHEQDASNNLFEMALRYYENCPEVVRPHLGSANSKELYFNKLDSGYKVATAGTKGAGRSSTIQYLHASEAAFWPNADEHAKGVMQAVPDAPGTEVFIESTANGVGNYFHQQWQMAESGDSDYIPVFIPWFWQTEYAKEPPPGFTLTSEEEDLREQFRLSNAQLFWRRSKIAELSTSGIDGAHAFRQEYPNTPADSFSLSGEDTLIQPETVTRARNEETAKRYGPLLVGVDPARFGDDRTSIVRRQGRVAYGLQSFKGKDTMEVAGLVYRIIANEKPTKVFIDVGGLGAGVVDRLREMGFGDVIVAVNGGERALDPEKFSNKRAEMWGLMNVWLQDRPCQVPNRDSLHSDLCGVKYKFDSKSRLVLEKKEDMKKRGVRSPDEADALALTFAEPVRSSTHIPLDRPVVGDPVIGY